MIVVDDVEFAMNQEVEPADGFDTIKRNKMKDQEGRREMNIKDELSFVSYYENIDVHLCL